MTRLTQRSAEGTWSTANAAAFPRSFRIAGHRVNAYRVFCCVGIYSGILTAAAVGLRSDTSPLRLGAGMLLVAIVGLLAARLYHMALHFRVYRAAGFLATARRPGLGGGSVLGSLVVVPSSLLFASIFGIPTGVFWDHAAIAIAVGGAWIRFGCICNGCCVGRDSDRWFALRQHDVLGVRRRRVPVQWLEIGWWLLACAGLVWLWPRPFPTGSYALAVLAWYGLGRVWLEPLRRESEVVRGLRVNQVVAAALTVVAGSAFAWRTL